MSAQQPWLVVQAQIDPAVIDEFERWLRDVHMRTILSIPGVVHAHRAYPSSGRPNYCSIITLRDDSMIRPALSSDEASLARAQWNRWIPFVEDGSLQVSVYASIAGSLALFQHN